MTTDQRQRVRKLQGKLCAKAVGYKGVDEQACADCESPCGYGVELLSVLGMEKPQTPAPVYPKVGMARKGGERRMIQGINGRWK